MQYTLISKDQILAARGRLKAELVDTPEWGGAVIVTELSGRDRDAFEADMIQLQGNGKQSVNLRNVRAKLAARAIVNPEDYEINEATREVTLKPDCKPRRLFNDLEANDLGDTSAAALERVWSRARELSGMSEKDIQELTGDLKNDQSAYSGTN